MSPIERAKAMYLEKLREPDEPDFEELLLEYMKQGFVVAGQDCFLLAKPAQLDDERPAWFVHFALGSLGELLKLMPYKLPFIAFHRHGQGRLRVYETDALIERGKSLWATC
jgi:hypothetical protein